MRDPAMGRARRAAHRLVFGLASVASLALGSACGNQETATEPTFRTREELLDPETCRECHATHYDEWRGSMHAYAAKDPVFLAMNRRGQRETGGLLGSFCVNCHAPLAVREAERGGRTVDDWSKVEELPYTDQGVGCYFCHNIASVEGTHNAQLTLANDVTMRGRIADPVPNPAHASAASPFLDGAKPESAAACGTCHDIVLDTPAAPPADPPVELERTYREWLSSIFAPENASVPSAMLTCAGCHMGPKDPDKIIAEGPGLAVRPRTFHPHTFPAVDLAFPSVPSTSDPVESQALRARQETEVREALDNTLSLEICVELAPLRNGAVQVTIDNSGAGHNWPSGASQDRRAWVEVTAYLKGQVLFTNAMEGDREPPSDSPNALIFRDRIFNGDREVHMFWEADDRKGGTIGPHQPLISTDPMSNPASRVQRFPASGFFVKPQGEDSSIPDRVTVRVRMRAMAHDVLDDLVRSGDLDPAIPPELPTFDLLPNRNLAELVPSLDTVSLEWSEAAKSAVRNSQAFTLVRDANASNVEIDCISMVRAATRR
jgi:hypothetical protein